MFGPKFFDKKKISNYFSSAQNLKGVISFAPLATTPLDIANKSDGHYI